MYVKFILYGMSSLVSAFAVSGINFDHFIRRNHVWEARFLAIILILTFSYILTNFIYDIVSINII